MQQWWENLSQREQWIVLGGTVATTILLIYAFAWSPFSEQKTQLWQEVERDQATIQYLRDAVPQLKQLRKLSPQQQQLQGSLLSVLENTARQGALANYPLQLQQGEKEAVKATFSNVPFHIMLNWLRQLEKQYGVAVVQASVRAKPEVGLVSATLTLSTASAAKASR